MRRRDPPPDVAATAPHRGAVVDFPEIARARSPHRAHHLVELSDGAEQRPLHFVQAVGHVGRWRPPERSAAAVTRAVRSSRLVASADSSALSFSMAAFYPRGGTARHGNRLPEPSGSPLALSVVLRRLDLRGTGADDLRRRLPRPAAQTEPPIDEVRAVLAEVRADGDAALRRFTERFDGAVLDDLRVPAAEVRAALDAIPAELRDALEAAHDNIAAYHAAQRGDEVVHHNGAIEIRELVRPVDRAGCYVPSALAPLVSTVLMTRRAGQGGRGAARSCWSAPARPDGRVARRHPRRRGPGRRRRGVPDRRPGRDRRPGLRHRVDPARST